MSLEPNDYPELGAARVNAINELTEEQLLYEIERGNASRFGERSRPLLRTALAIIENERLLQDRQNELDMATKANEIANDALEHAKNSSKWARIWSGIAILVSLLLALVSYSKS